MSPNKGGGGTLLSRQREEPSSSTTSSSCGKKFLSNNKREHYYRVRYEWEFNKFLTSSKEKLSSIHTVYPNAYVERDVTTQDKIWEAMIHLQNVIIGEDWSDYRKNKLLRDLHDNFDELSSKRFLSKPNFECCMLKACRGYSHRKSTTSTAVAEQKLNVAMDLVYSTFDVHSLGAFDWRRFLFYLHFLLDPRKSVKDQLLSAFAKIGHKSCRLELQELEVVLFPLVKASGMKDVLFAMDEAWAQVKAAQQKVDDENLECTMLSMGIFQQMLEMQVLQIFFDQSESSWGKGRIFPTVYISRWEEELYNKTLLDLVRMRRRDAVISEKLKHDRCKTKRHAWRLWLDYAKYQGSLRSILVKINCRMALRRKARGICAFSHWVRMQHAALDIQRVARGYFGRNVARHCWMVYTSATMIQTRYRMHLARKVLHALWTRYIWAIVTVQSAIRGALARRLALKKLMTLVEQEHLSNIKERERYEMERGIWGLTRLQSFRRKQIAIATSIAMRQKVQREAQIQRAMETERKMFLRERQIYERQLEGFYRSMKEEHENNSQIQDKVHHDQVKVRTLRRRLKHQEMKDAEPDLELEEQLAVEKWKNEWTEKIEAGVAKIQLHSNHCLDQPDNSVEKQTRKAIRKQIKGRVKDVLSRADEQRIPMETKEAKVIAREEIIHIIGEEERSRLCNEMDNAFIERARLKEEERKQAEVKAMDAHKRASIYAVSLVAAACRKWLARKELRRLCLQTYEKIFDESSHAFYYRNKHTGETSWTKPKAMGVFEIPAKDEWKLLRDAHNFPYYFNPLLIEMSWTPPLDKDMCCGTVPHTWWREYPVRSGPCPRFSCVLNEDDGIRYCQDCFEDQVGG